MGIYSFLQNHVGTREGKMMEESNLLRRRQMEREEAAAAREEENLLRRQGMANFATSPSLEAAYPEMIAQPQQRNALDQADPAAALGRLESKLYPKGYTGTLKPRERAFDNGVVVAEGLPEETVFKPAKMRIPGTDRIVMARTPEEYDANIEAGFVDDSGAVPGAPSPADKKSTPNDYMEDPNNPGRRVMVPGGSAAAARAEALSKPVLDERKAYNEASNQYATMTDLANDDTGASDISLVYTFFKANDPVSSVREGEFATVGEKMGLPSQIIGQLKSLSSGQGFLTKDVREALVNTAGRAIKQRKRGLQRSYKDASAGIDSLGVDRKAFLPFNVADVKLDEVRKEYPDAKEDTAGRVYVIQNGKRKYVELNDE